MNYKELGAFRMMRQNSNLLAEKELAGFGGRFKNLFDKSNYDM